MSLHEARAIMLAAVLMYITDYMVLLDRPVSDPERIAQERNIDMRRQVMDVAVAQYANLLKYDGVID